MDECLIIYHAGCTDGWCSAWVIYRWLLEGGIPAEEITLHAARHGAPPPDVRDRSVWIVDFCFDRKTTEALIEQAGFLHVIDHHVTAAGALSSLPTEGTSHRLTFDMQRSGAGLAWDTLRPGEARPWIVDYVEDRDLWRHALPDSAEVATYLATVPHDVDAWGSVCRRGLMAARYQGEVMLRYRDAQIEQAVRNTEVRDVFGHAGVPVVNSCLHQSELGQRLLEQHPDAPFAAIWWRRADGLYRWSLRSTPARLDVAALAQSYGGGGHATASGCTTEELWPT